MKVLLVHGMNRTSLSMRRLGGRLRAAGAEPEYFGYVPAFQPVELVAARLEERLRAMAAGDYAVVGHSLGGLLLRLAVARLPAAARKPRLLALLGSPHRSPRLSRVAQRYLPFRLVNGDGGRLLASEERMAAVPLPPVPTLVVAGNGGSRSPRGPFGGEENDGIVALSEARIDGVPTVVVPAGHTFLMNHPATAAALLGALRGELPGGEEGGGAPIPPPPASKR